MRQPIYRGLLLACLCTVGCDDDDNNDQPQELTVATYNMGLLNSVGFVQQRAPLAIQAASELDVDVLCVQEVWEQEHWDELVAAQSEVRPHTLRLPAEPGAMGMCSPDTFNPLEACAQEKCSGAADLTTCVTSMCAEEVAELEGGCISCLLENVGSGDFVQIRAACVGGEAGESPNERSYVSGGSYGIGLLSSREFAETDELRLDASTVRRGVLYARIDDKAFGSVHVFCTHLAAILDGVRYEGSYGDWEAENAAHVEELIAWVDEKAGRDGKVIVLGDLNTGPAGDGIQPSVPDNYALLPEAGFANPFLSGPNAACTFCTDNPLVLSEDGAAGATIDHILTRGIRGPVETERVLEDEVTIEVSTESGTSTETVALSDHYGLVSRIRL